MQRVTSNGTVVIDAAELEKVSGGWCGNDPLFWRHPQPPEPLSIASIVNVVDAVSLNPQPLPPKELSF